MISDRSAKDPLLASLGENSWMVGVRAVLAIVFGFLLLLRPAAPLDRVVALFIAYVVLDGVWTIASALWVTGRSFAGWPVVLEGLVSLLIGLLALLWPLVPHRLVVAIVVWGLLTGVLELVAALRLPRTGAGYWLYATGGACSLFLAVLILMLIHADQAYVVSVLGIYALAFGVLLAAAAAAFRKAVRSR